MLWTFLIIQKNTGSILYKSSPMEQEEKAKAKLREYVRAWKQRREDKKNGKNQSESGLFYLRPKPWAHVGKNIFASN